MCGAIIGYRPCDLVELPKAEVGMTSSTDISALYRELTDALTEVLAEKANGSTRRGHLARTRAAVKKHLCVPRTSSALISRRNRLTSARHDRAAGFRTGRLGRAFQVEEPA